MVKHHQYGFILLEVLVGIFILAIIGSTVLQIASQQLIVMTQSRDKVFADWVADNQLVQLHLIHGEHNRLWVSGTSMMAGRKWNYEYRYKDSPYPATDILEIEVRTSVDGPVLANIVTAVSQ